jgi:hypothetical protein
VREALNRAVADKLAANGLACETKRVGTSTFFLYPPEAYERTDDGTYRFPDAVNLLNLRDQGNQHAISPALEHRPSISRTHIIDIVVGALERLRPDQMVSREVRRWLRTALPGSRGPLSVAMFEARLVATAHDALLREHPAWGCRAACEELATRLQITPRTVKNLRRRAIRPSA